MADRRGFTGGRCTVVALVGCLALATLSGGTAIGGPRAPQSPSALAGIPAGQTLPDRIGAPARVLQMVTVVSDGWSNTTGILRAWQRPAGGAWTKVHGPLPIALGYNGWVIAAERVQSSGTSPAGRFGLPAAFGVLSNPGTALHYNHVDSDDWWPYEPRDPATYNIYQYHKDSHTHWRADYAEHLTNFQTQYAYAVVVGFNLPKGVHYSPQRHQRVASEPANTKIGGGIFLHVRGSGSTAGCISMDKVHMAWLLQWLDPKQYPQVVMGPYDYVLTL